MNIFRVFSRRNGETRPSQPQAAVPPCRHSRLAAHWDQADDMGKRDKVAYYTCDTCQQTVSQEEGERLRARLGD